jgi:hypothetical protein
LDRNHLQLINLLALLLCPVLRLIILFSSRYASSMSSSTSTPTKEPDKAGGEVVFSSDGMDQIPPPAAPSKLSSRSPPAAAASGEGSTFLVNDEGFDVSRTLEAFGAGPGGSSSRGSSSERLQAIESELNRLQLEVAEDQALQSKVRSLQDRLRRQQQAARGFMSASEEDSASAGEPLTPRSDVEALLARLEKAVGCMNDEDPSGRGLLERLRTLEESLGVLSDSKLEATRAKVKVIRQDLEAASKAKNKLLSGGGDRAGADPKVIGELYDALQHVTPMQSLLPILAQRLEVLQVQHHQMATWSSRLSSLEATAKLLETAIKSAEASAAKLEGSWQATIVPQLEANLKALDDRLQQLQSK